MWVHRSNKVVMDDLSHPLSLWLHRGSLLESPIAFWRHPDNNLVVTPSIQLSIQRCGYIGAASLLWLHRGSNIVLAVSSHQSCYDYIEATISLWLYRGNNLVVAKSWEESRCGCFEAPIISWLHRANPIVVAISRKQSCFSCIEPFVAAASGRKYRCGCI